MIFLSDLIWIPFAIVVGLGLEVARRWRQRRRVWLHAFLEQQRREDEHHLPYRRDQRVRAIQQRLSRAWGSRALSPRMKRRIEVALGVDHPA